MAGIRIEGNTSGNVAEVDASNNLRVVQPATQVGAVYVAAMGESSTASDPGGQIRRPLEVNDDFILRVGEDQTMLVSSFGGSATSANAIQQDLWLQTATTMTATAGSPTNGFLRLNASAITTVTTGIWYRTYPTYNIWSPYPTYVEFEARTINGNQTGKVIELGQFLVTSGTSAGLLDGICFRWLNNGEFRGIVSFNGTEVQTAALTLPPNTEVHRFTISVSQDAAEFWVDNALQARLEVPTGVSGLMLQQSLPVSMRIYNNVAPALAAQVEIARVMVSYGAQDTGKPWPFIMSGMQQHAANVPYGTAVGQTSGNSNQAAVPTTAAASNTSALVTGLGGVAQVTAQATNTTATGDNIITSYQVPAVAATQASKRLCVTGVHISCMNNGAAVATTPTTLLWSLAFGHTAVTLATGDAVTTKAPRRLMLGFMTAPIGAVVGATFDRDIRVTFATPIYVNPGELIASVARFIVGTATASQAIVCSVGFEGFWE